MPVQWIIPSTGPGAKTKRTRNRSGVRRQGFWPERGPMLEWSSSTCPCSSMDRAPDFESVGCAFESRRGRLAYVVIGTRETTRCTLSPKGDGNRNRRIRGSWDRHGETRPLWRVLLFCVRKLTSSPICHSVHLRHALGGESSSGAPSFDSILPWVTLRYCKAIRREYSSPTREP